MGVKPIYVLGGGLIYVGATFVAYKYLKKDPTADSDLPDRFPTKEERLGVMNDIATIYDSDLVTSKLEWWIGIEKLRKKQLALAKGKVLEIAGGTGKNFVHYTKDCTEILFLDSSKMMLQTANWKFKKLNKTGKLKLAPDTKVRFQVSDAENLNIIADDSFDTVIDSFGLCSFDDPVKAVKEMGRVCKPDGKIVLLEHGRSNFHTWLNNYILDPYVKAHAWKYGCNWNRDIPDIVTEAGLYIESEKRKHFGTDILIIASPTKPLSKD